MHNYTRKTTEQNPPNILAAPRVRQRNTLGLQGTYGWCWALSGPSDHAPCGRLGYVRASLATAAVSRWSDRCRLMDGVGWGDCRRQLGLSKQPWGRTVPSVFVIPSCTIPQICAG